jgi:DNA polymerase-3 subunit beta
MKFTIQSTAIEGAAILLSKVINAKNPLPILGDILCEVANNQLTMTGSDGECSIGTTLDLDTMEGEGRFCLDAGRLLTAARQLGDQPLTITCCTESDYMFTIEHQDGQIHFLAESADEYPVIEQPIWESNFHNLQSNRIGEAIKRCLWSASTNEMRPAICGVHICTVQKYDALDIVASDGHALVRTRMLNKDIESGQKIDATIPTKAAKVLADTLTEVEPISLRFAEGKCQVETTRYCMTFRLVDQPYPKYNSIIPTDNTIEACVGNRELARSIKRVLPFAPDKSQMLSLHFEADKLTVMGDDFDFSEGARDKVAADFNCSDPLTIGIKGTTLAKALGYIDDTDVRIKMKDATRAILLEPKEQDEHNEVTILMMPMLLND